MNADSKSALDAMTRLQRLGLKFLQERTLEPVLTEIVDTAIAFSGADFGNIQLLVPETSRLRIVASRGFEPWWVEYWNHVKEGEGACGSALEANSRVIVENVEESPIFKGKLALEIMRKSGVKAVQSTPLRTWSGKLIGMFSTHYKTTRRPDDEALRLLDILAYQAAAIIERSLIEKALRKANEDLHQKVSELDIRAQELGRANVDLAQFASVASHDLKEPLRVIKTHLQFVERLIGGNLSPDAAEHMQYVKDAAGRMFDLINDLLAFSKAGAPERKSTLDTNKVVQEVVKNLSPVIEECRANLEIGSLPSVYAVSFQIRQLFQNLLENALKYRNGEAPKIFVRAEVGDREVVFSVKDNGIGIDPKFSKKVFELFQRLHHRDQYSGTGIGLAICKRIVEQHGGRIWFESTPGAGTDFKFTLPLAPQEVRT